MQVVGLSIESIVCCLYGHFVPLKMAPALQMKALADLFMSYPMLPKGVITSTVPTTGVGCQVYWPSGYWMLPDWGPHLEVSHSYITWAYGDPGTCIAKSIGYQWFIVWLFIVAYILVHWVWIPAFDCESFFTCQKGHWFFLVVDLGPEWGKKKKSNSLLIFPHQNYFHLMIMMITNIQ